jgi:hypothetical protein
MNKKALFICLLVCLVAGNVLGVSEKLMASAQSETDPKKDAKKAPATKSSGKPAKKVASKQKAKVAKGKPQKKQAAKPSKKKANSKAKKASNAASKKKPVAKSVAKKKPGVVKAKPKAKAKPKVVEKPKPVLDPRYELVVRLDKKTGKQIKFIRKKRDPIIERKRNLKLQAMIKKTEAKLAKVHKELSKYSDKHFYNHLQNELGHLLNSVHYEGNLEVKVKKKLPKNPLDIKVEMVHNLRGKSIPKKRIQSVIDLVSTRGKRKSAAELKRQLEKMERSKQPGGHVGKEKPYVPDELRYAKFRRPRAKSRKGLSKNPKAKKRRCGKRCKKGSGPSKEKSKKYHQTKKTALVLS